MATTVAPDDPGAQRLAAAITTGGHDALRALLVERPELATVYVGSAHTARSSLHLATDWPGHFPGVATTIEILVAAGADLDAPFIGRHTERPLHWAASSGDVVALDTLIAAGADLEASGGVLTGGTPLDDAVIFDMLECAHHLVDAGAAVALFHAAALGMEERIPGLLEGADRQRLDSALWHACHQRQTPAARLLLAAGADPKFEGFDDQTPLDAARATNDVELIALVEGAADG